MNEVFGMVEHKRSLSWLGMVLSASLPALLISAGFMGYGLAQIDWSSILIFGVLGTLAYTALVFLLNMARLTSFNPISLLGSAFAPPKSLRAKVIGATIHHGVGVFLAIAGAFVAQFLNLELDWFFGTLWGLFASGMALIAFSSVGFFHPGVKKDHIVDPGFLGLNMGTATPFAIVLGHMVFGFILGLGYQTF